MSQPTIYEKIRDAGRYIQSRTNSSPKLGIILGSGLGSLADEAKNKVSIRYTDIPFFYGTSVEGHAGELIVGDFHGISCVFLKGRFHLYEGYPMEVVVLPTRTVCALGIETLILTNAAGGINTRFRPGDLMVLRDHINLMGDNPLRGKNLAELGPRFPDLTEAYSTQYIEVIQQSAQSLGLSVHSGVYAALLGPTYETPAEVQMLRTLGADAVGMSTVPECIAANHLGVQVLGLSCITNLAAGLSPRRLTHDEVIANSKVSIEKLSRILQHAVPRLLPSSSRPREQFLA